MLCKTVHFAFHLSCYSCFVELGAFVEILSDYILLLSKFVGVSFNLLYSYT